MTHACGGGPGPGLFPEHQGQFEGRETSRDVFPLPSLQISARPSGPLSRGCRQRSGRRIHFEEEARHTADALNRMYEGTMKTGFGESAKHAGNLSAGQDAVFEFIRRSVRDLGAPTGISGPEG